jgi:thiosulfate/3-mercaptopyruvate sulfurtransferase
VFTTLVSPNEVYEHRDDVTWVVVDCRHALADFSLGRKQYESAHIPGAFFADIENDLAGPKNGKNGRHPLPDPQAFARYLRAIGVEDDSQIVAYDAGCDMFAARLWFLCRWIGLENVAVLDGGFAAWEAAGLPTTSEPTIAFNTGSLHVHMHPEFVVDKAQVRSDHPHAFTVLDARAADRYAGENETVDPVAGHIPGALNRPFKNNFDATGHFKSAPELRKELDALGLPPSAIVHQCGSGVSSAVNALAMEIANLKGSRVYAGSWSEWIADPSSPIATGSAP